MSKVTVLEFAQLASDVYNRKSKYSNSLNNVSSWLAVNKNGDPSSNFSLNFNKDFFARLYVKVIGKIPVAAVVAYRGTLISDLGNLYSDAEIDLHKKPKSFPLAVNFYVLAKQFALSKYGVRVKLTGHSLGGVLAQLVAIKAKPHPQTVVFNSPGIGGIKGIDSTENYPYIHNFNSKEGCINKVNKTLGSDTTLNVISPDKTLSEKIINAVTDNCISQHKIKNVIAALKTEPAVAREAF